MLNQNVQEIENLFNNLENEKNNSSLYINNDNASINLKKGDIYNLKKEIKDLENNIINLKQAKLSTNEIDKQYFVFGLPPKTYLIIFGILIFIVFFIIK